MMSLAPGAQLGPYEVHSLLGSGGMGEVYRAKDTKLNREVALKCLCQSEVEHGLEESGGAQALVLELVEGPTLADRIDTRPFPMVNLS